RALGGLPVSAARAGRGARGRIPARTGNARQGDRPRRPQLGAERLALAGRARERRTGRSTARLRRSPPPQPAGAATAAGRRRMTPRAKTTPGSAASPKGAAPGRPDPSEPAAASNVDIAEEMRQRGALLRRLLATGDWLVLIAALCVATATTSAAD